MEMQIDLKPIKNIVSGAPWFLYILVNLHADCRRHRGGLECGCVVFSDHIVSSLKPTTFLFVLLLGFWLFLGFDNYTLNVSGILNAARFHNRELDIVLNKIQNVGH